METTEIENKRTHHGHAVKRIRNASGIKQTGLGIDLGLTQQEISEYEKKEVIDDEMLEKFAKILKVPVKVIKELEEDPVAIYIENNHFDMENNEKVTTNTGYNSFEDNSTNTFNPIDKVIELVERLVKAEQEKIELLKKIAEKD